MPFTIRILDDSNIFELHFEGTVNAEEILQARSQVHSIFDRHGLMHGLIDLHGVKLDMSTMEIYDFAATAERPPGMRIALVGDDKDDNIRFLQTAAINKGVPMELFADYSDALAYLTE